MSQENVEIVRRYFEAVIREDLDGWKALLASEVEFVPLAANLQGGPARGVENVARSVGEFIESFASYSLSPEAFYDAGDQVVAVLHRTAESARSSALIEDRFAQLFWLRDGRIIRMHSFQRIRDALEAAGLSE
jgi:ketosteroid isomerase-like protein